MKKHIVTCVKCGRQFDANEGGAYYPESRRYVCKRCVDKQKSEQADREKARKAEERKAEADERERVSGMRQSKAASELVARMDKLEAVPARNGLFEFREIDFLVPCGNELHRLFLRSKDFTEIVIADNHIDALVIRRGRKIDRIL